MELTQKSDADILAIVGPIMDNLMDASTSIDYGQHTRDFTERAKSVLSRDALQSICEHYQNARGFFAKREFVAVFRRPDSVAVVWRQWFTTVPGEFVAELVLVQRDGRYLVDHVMVF
jgi:hypothetical protein